MIDIKQRRKELGYTLDELGRRCGVNKSTVMRWEKGEIGNMKRDKIYVLCNALNISPVDFLKDVSPQTVESATEQEILFAFRALSKPNQFKLIAYAYELKEKENTSAATDMSSSI